MLKTNHVEHTTSFEHKTFNRFQACAFYVLAFYDWVLKESESSSVYACSDSKGLSGSLNWVCKDAVYCEIAARDEMPGMSGAWDWELKETSC